MPRGVLIALEGVDGAGKTTQAALLAGSLAHGGRRVLLTREPTRGATGRRLRAYLTGDRRDLSPAQELELFQADRREHVERTLRPALEQGWVVISDRYYYSSVAYQGALGLDPEAILAANEAFAPRPDLVFLLLLPPVLGWERCLRNRGPNLQVSEGVTYLGKVAAIYEGLKGDHLRKMDATLPALNLQALLHNLTLNCLQAVESARRTDW